jgi:outer membrane protein TolC
MLDFRRARLGAGGLSLAVALIGIASPHPSDARASKAVVAQASAAPASAAPASAAPGGASPSPAPLELPVAPAGGKRLNAGQPTPYPYNTLAPLGTNELPFPAYGTPVPGVNKGSPAPDVPVPISLNQSELIGFARSPALAIARADVGVQAAAVRLARAGLLPNLSAAAGYDYDHSQAGTINTSTNAALITGRGSNHTSNVTLDATLTQLIYDGGKIAASVDAAERGETADADAYRRELQTVAFDVASAYYTYLSAERLTQVDREIVREDEVQLDLVEAQVKAGVEARSEIATAQLPVAQARLAVVKAQGAELSAEAAFANAMGLDANVLVQPIDDAPVFTNSVVSTIPVPSYDQALVRAYALRPDYYGSIDSVQQAQYSLRSAKLGLFPTLAGTATAADDTSNATAGAFRNQQELGVTLSIPIYDQGQTAANVASARATLDSAYASLQNEKLTVELNVKQALTNLVASSQAVTETQQEYATALVNVQATQAQYRAGVTTLPLLLDAQVGLTQALTDQVTAVYTLRQAEQSYLYEIGANYDTSADNGTTRVRPTPGPQAQGGRTALRGASPAHATRSTAATLAH